MCQPYICQLCCRVPFSQTFPSAVHLYLRILCMFRSSNLLACCVRDELDKISFLFSCLPLPRRGRQVDVVGYAMLRMNSGYVCFFSASGFVQTYSCVLYWSNGIISKPAQVVNVLGGCVAVKTSVFATFGLWTLLAKT